MIIKNTEINKKLVLVKDNYKLEISLQKFKMYNHKPPVMAIINNTLENKN